MILRSLLPNSTTNTMKTRRNLNNNKPSKLWPMLRSCTIIYSASCILLALLASLAIVLNGADCHVTSNNSNVDRVTVVRPLMPNLSSSQDVKNSFRDIFDRLTIHVKENTPPGSKLADIQAVQQDPSNSKFIYAIVGGDDQQSFTLRVDNNLNKVELVNEVNFDYESPKKSYHVNIRATSLFLRYDVDVDIMVTDENDNQPQLEDFAIIFNNYKNHFPTLPIGRIPATDADVNDQLTYKVISGNNAQLVIVNETTGAIQLSPSLNSNVPMKAIMKVAVHDGDKEASAEMVLTVNLVTETMLQNSVVLRLDGINREEFLTKKYDIFINNIAKILGVTNNQYIVVFDIEESLQESTNHDSALTYRVFHGVSTSSSNLSVNVSFSARADGNDLESYLTSQYIEERIHLNRVSLMQALNVHVAPFQDNLCVKEPCQNYQECQATYKFDKAPKFFLTTRNIIFRPIRAVQSFTCNCPSTFTGMKHKTECNLQINQCFSNPCLNGGICHQHESGYTCQCKREFVGNRCEHSFANSTCESFSYSAPSAHPMMLLEEQTSKKPLSCGGKSKCVNKPHTFAGSNNQIGNFAGGFSCQNCPNPQSSNELCQLRVRSFNKNSYMTLPGLRKRHRFNLQLQFATVQTDALLLYNGRYNGKHDFIALEIVDSYLKFSYSLGSIVSSVSLNSSQVSNGDWHKVTIDYKDRNVTILLDDCDPVIDEALARLQGATSKRCSNTTYGDTYGLPEFKILDLNAPMQIGASPGLPSEYQISNINSFIGCISDIHIDHQLVDLYTPIQEVGTQVGCPVKRTFCRANTCNGHPCQDSWGAARCTCDDEYLGKSCEIIINNEKVRRFNGNSYLTFNPIESSITVNWQLSLHFRTINPNGLLMKISLDSGMNVMLEMLNGGLRLSYNSHNITFAKIPLDDGEWHFVEMTWQPSFAQLQLDYNPNLSAQSSEMGNIVGNVMKSVTVGASASRSADSQTSAGSGESLDFSSSIVNIGTEEYSNMYLYNSSGTQSFVGCIYGLNFSDNLEQWISGSDERNVERGCQVADICETNPCPPNSRCSKKGMNQRRCICNPGFVGDRCLPVCELQPCQGELSRCISVSEAGANPNDAASSSYRCECEPHRSGKNCEHQLNARCPSNWWGRPAAGSNASICGPCNCDESKGFDGDCDKTTGQCFCKQNHYQSVGADYCLACDCYATGSLSGVCNQTTGQCKCRPGVVGRRCDTCASSYAEVTLRGCEVIYDSCPKTFTDGIWWNTTPLGEEAKQQCPPATSTGTASRVCSKTDGWQKAFMFDCLSNSFSDLYTQYQFLLENKITLTASLAAKLASSLNLALNETISSPSTQLYGTDIYISFRLIHYLIQHEISQSGMNLTHRQDRLYIRNIVESISYILDPEYAENWPEISARSPEGGAEHLLKLMDSYGKVLIESQSDTFTQPFEVATKYFTFGMDTLSTDQLWDLSKFGSPQTSPPYATDPFGPPLDQSYFNAIDSHPSINADGSSTFLDYSLSKDSSPAITIPRYDNYLSDSAANPTDNTKAIIPLKTLRIKTVQELLPLSYYAAKSARAKRDELSIPDFKGIRQQPALVVYSIYRSLGPLLPNNHDNTVQNRLGMVASPNSPVVWLTPRPANSSEFLSKNIQPKIMYMLKMVETSGKTRPQCAVWNFVQPSSSLSKNQSLVYGIKQTGKFTTKGCEVKGYQPNHKLKFKYDYVNCSCDHLGAVTVLMDSANYDYLSGEETNVKNLSIIVALCISIPVLVCILFVLSCIRGHSIKSNSNSINKNLIFILIAVELLILYTIMSRSSLNQREYHCKLVAIFLHYFSISLFFWLLVNAIHFYRMLTELRDINHGPMKFYHVIGYAVPAFFVSIAVGLRIEQFGNYLFCWLSIHEPIIWSMFGPISFVSALIIILFIQALCSSMPIKEDQSGADLLKNHILINLIKTPLIGLYWIITVYAVNEALLDYVFIYPAVTIIKSVALFLLLCVLDKHIRYNLYVSWLRFRGFDTPVIEDPYSASQWMPSSMVDPMSMSKKYPYAFDGQLTTPGFQSSCTDIFRPDVLPFSVASTTSRSSDSESSFSDYPYQHRARDTIDRDASYAAGAERSRRRGTRRKHKKHHKHHHHRHHHHHHHHRSHRHNRGDDYEQHYDSRSRVYEARHASVGENNNNNTRNELASSHSSDGDDASSLSKRNFSNGNLNAANNQKQESREKEQTLPMEVVVAGPSTSGQADSAVKISPTENN